MEGLDQTLQMGALPQFEDDFVVARVRHHADIDRIVRPRESQAWHGWCGSLKKASVCFCSRTTRMRRNTGKTFLLVGRRRLAKADAK